MSWSSSTSRTRTPRVSISSGIRGDSAPLHLARSPSKALRLRSAAGSRTSRRVPRPRWPPWTVPPCSSTRCLHDRETQPEAAVAARWSTRSAWRKRSKTCGEELRADARCPVSRDGDLALRRRRGRAPRRRGRPAGVNLMAFESRFHTTCCSRAGSPRIGGTVLLESRSRARRPWPRAAASPSRSRTRDRAASRRLLELERQLARHDAGSRRAGRRRAAPAASCFARSPPGRARRFRAGRRPCA